MLKVEDRFMIKDLYRRGMSISEIARTTGHDRKTIRSIVNSPVNPPPKKRKKRASILDPFVPYLERRMEEGVLNCNKLIDEIRKQGYEGGKSTLKNFVQPYREARRQEATVRFETLPGEQAQVDWGHFGFIQHQGRRRKLYGFVMTLGWSRASYLEFTISADTAWWLRCHIHAFRYLGGYMRNRQVSEMRRSCFDRDCYLGYTSAAQRKRGKSVASAMAFPRFSLLGLHGAQAGSGHHCLTSPSAPGGCSDPIPRAAVA
jgi:transposase